VEVLHSGYPLVYLRGGSRLVVINPRREPARATAAGMAAARPLEVRGVKVVGEEISADGFSYGIFSLS